MIDEQRPHDSHPSLPLKGEEVSVTPFIEHQTHERRMVSPSPLRGGARGGGRAISIVTRIDSEGIFA
jgi:hypothetical protein